MAKYFIDSNLDQPGLSVGDVASAVGVSERQLSRVFADHGIGVAESIAEVRLAAAYDMLTSTRADGLSIGEIARRVGYMHLSHFSRSFKAKYGMTARDVKDSLSSACYQHHRRGGPVAPVLDSLAWTSMTIPPAPPPV